MTWLTRERSLYFELPIRSVHSLKNSLYSFLIELDNCENSVFELVSENGTCINLGLYRKPWKVIAGFNSVLFIYQKDRFIEKKYTLESHKIYNGSLVLDCVSELIIETMITPLIYNDYLLYFKSTLLDTNQIYSFNILSNELEIFSSICDGHIELASNLEFYTCLVSTNLKLFRRERLVKEFKDVLSSKFLNGECMLINKVGVSFIYSYITGETIEIDRNLVNYDCFSKTLYYIEDSILNILKDDQIISLSIGSWFNFVNSYYRIGLWYDNNFNFIHVFDYETELWEIEEEISEISFKSEISDLDQDRLSALNLKLQNLSLIYQVSKNESESLNLESNGFTLTEERSI